MARESTVRDRIVAAALDRFHTLGYTATGVQEIVDLAGVPKGSFYNYFKAKEHLAIETLKLYLQASRRDMLSDRKIAPLDRVRTHFDLMAAQYEAHGYSKGCLIGNMFAEITRETPLIQEFLRNALQNWTTALSGVISEGQADGAIRSDVPPDQTARYMINGWEGAIIRMKLTDSGESLEDFFELMFPWLTGDRRIGNDPA